MWDGGSKAGGEIMGADARLETLMLPGALTNTPTPIEHGSSYTKPNVGGYRWPGGRLALQSAGDGGMRIGSWEESSGWYRPGRAREK